ncbi:2Fe-2S ferredoxin [Rubrivivax gelatinosus]|nr:2Fe-2S ferredoxin [Rubrivivax gelatinosus]
MTLARAGGVPLCAAADLAEGGLAHVWDVLDERGRPARAFVLRWDGRIVAYLNRCAHLPAELDWQPGRFLDSDGRLIVCAMHGAVYEPADGRCIGGPGAGGRLLPLEVAEVDGQVTWYPSREIRPAPPADESAT